MLRNSSNSYGAVAKLLHWVIAAAIIVMVFLGFGSGWVPRGPWVGKILFIHKSLGLTILLLMLVRLGWRWLNPIPSYPKKMPLWEIFSAKTVQFLFYILIIAIVVVGLSMSSFAGHATVFWGWINVSLPVIQNKNNAHLLANIHFYIAWIIIALFVLHVSGAYYHHWFKKDDVLNRMLGCASNDEK